MSRMSMQRSPSDSDSCFDPSDDDESAVNDMISPRKGAKASSSRLPVRSSRGRGANRGGNNPGEEESGAGSSRGGSVAGSEERRTKRTGGRRSVKAAAGERHVPIASFVGPAHKPEILCAFCQGTAAKNLATKQAEILISCVECGSSGHPSCMKWGRNLRKTAVAQNYNWRCMECKTCEVCCEKGDDSKIMFCDRCDRGWHLDCLDPPMTKPPKGTWNCPTCKAIEGHVRQEIEHQSSHSSKSKRAVKTSAHYPLIGSPLSSSFGAWEAGPNLGSAALGGSLFETTSPFKGPMKASIPYPVDGHDDANSSTRDGMHGSKGANKRVRKPTDLNRSYEVSQSPRRSDSPSTGPHSRANSHTTLVRGEEKKGKGKTAGHSIIVRIKRHSKQERGEGGLPARNGSVRKARPKSLLIPDVDFEQEEESEEESWTSAPTPRALSASDEEDERGGESEQEDPFGGILSEADADTSKTVPTVEDKERFEKSKSSAETKLGGAVANLPGSMSGRILKKPGKLAFDANLLTSSTSSASSYFTGSPWAGTGSNGEKARSGRGAKGMSGGARLSEPCTPATPGTPAAAESSKATLAESGEAIAIKTIRFGGFDIDTWYQAPYPEEYSLVPDGRLWICEHCLKYMKSRFMATRHRMKCKMRHPPGAEIYRDGNVSVFEVDGRKNKIYCQNLCLLAKMFLDHKTLYYDVEPFLFYVVAEVDELGAHFVGYFSKEKRSPLNYNVSCIMTLPIRQRRGWGNFIIDISYLLSKKESRLGSPEKPLSDLGLLSYRNYWTLAVFYFLRSCSDHVSLQDISMATSMTMEDVFYVLREQDMITVSDGQSGRIRAPATSKYKSREGGVSSSATGTNGVTRPRRRRPSSTVERDKEGAMTIPSEYKIHFDRDYVFAHIKNYEAKGYLQVRPEKLHWTPFLVNRSLVQPDVSAKSVGVSQTGQDSAALSSMMARGEWQEQQQTEVGSEGHDRCTPSTKVEERDADEVDGHVLQTNGKPRAGEDPASASPPSHHILLQESGQPKVIVPASTNEQTPFGLMERPFHLASSPPLVKTGGEKRSPSPTSTAHSTPGKRARHTMEKAASRTGSNKRLEPVVEIAATIPLRDGRQQLEQAKVRAIYAVDEDEPLCISSDEDAPGSDDPMLD